MSYQEWEERIIILVMKDLEQLMHGYGQTFLYTNPMSVYREEVCMY